MENLGFFLTLIDKYNSWYFLKSVLNTKTKKFILISFILIMITIILYFTYCHSIFAPFVVTFYFLGVFFLDKWMLRARFSHYYQKYPTTMSLLKSENISLRLFFIIDELKKSGNFNQNKISAALRECDIYLEGKEVTHVLINWNAISLCLTVILALFTSLIDRLSIKTVILVSMFFLLIFASIAQLKMLFWPKYKKVQLARLILKTIENLQFK